MKTVWIILSLTVLFVSPGWAGNPYQGPGAKYKTIKPSQLKLPNQVKWKPPKGFEHSKTKAWNKYWSQGANRHQQYYQNSKALTQRLNKMKFPSPKPNMPRLPKSNPTPMPKPRLNPMAPTQQQMFNKSMNYMQQGMQKRQQNAQPYTPPAGNNSKGSRPSNASSSGAARRTPAQSQTGTSGTSGNTMSQSTHNTAPPRTPKAPPTFIQPDNDLAAPTGMIQGSPAFIEPDLHLAPPPGAIEGSPAFIEPTAGVLAPPGDIMGGSMSVDSPFLEPMDVGSVGLEAPQWGDGQGTNADNTSVSSTYTNQTGQAAPQWGDNTDNMETDTTGASAETSMAGFFMPTADTGVTAPQWGGGTNNEVDPPQANGTPFGGQPIGSSFGSTLQTTNVPLSNTALDSMKKGADDTNQAIFEAIQMAKLKQLKAQAEADRIKTEQEVQEVEEIAELLNGYESPHQSDPGSLSIDLTPVNPNEGHFEAPEIAGADGGSGNLALGPPPRGKHFSQAESVQMNEEGMVWSEAYNDWVSPDILQMDQDIKDDFQERQDENAQERDGAWKQYWEENGDPTFDKGLQQLSNEVQDAKQKVENSDVAAQYADYVEKYNDTHDMLSPDQIKHMRDQMQRAVDRGAGEEELKDLAKKYVALGMEEQKAIAAEAEEDEAAAELGIELSKGTAQALGTAASGGMGLLAGRVVEGGSAFAVGCAEKGFWGGVEHAFRETLPVNTALTLNKMRKGEKVTYTELIAGMISDVASSFDVADGLGKAFKGAGAADEVAGAAAKVNKNYDMDSLVNDLNLEKQNKRNAAYFAGRQEGYDAVDKFEMAALMGDKKAMKELTVEIQGNKHAMRAMQEKSKGLWKDFNTQIDDIYDAADNKALELANQKIKPKDLGPDVKNVVEFEVVKVTNPSTEVKVSYDRDWTLRAKVKMKDGSIKRIDVPPKHSADLYNESYYEAAKGVPPPNKDAAKMFAHKQDQVVTYKLSSDAYGSGYKDFDVAFDEKKIGKFSDPEQVGQVMAYKSDEWYREADKLNLKATKYEQAAMTARKTGDLQKAAKFEQQALKCVGQAEAATEEGMRQFTKQYDKQLVPRFKAVGLSEADLPPRLMAAKEVLDRVGTGPNQGFTPAQAQSALKVFGYNSIEDVGTDMGKCLEALQKFKIKS